MKNHTIRYLLAAVVIGLAAASGLKSGVRASLHRQLQHRLADARTVVAAVRYLTDFEPPDLHPHPAAWEFAATNLPKTPARLASRVVPNDTNLPSVIISNRVATTQTGVTAPG